MIERRWRVATIVTGAAVAFLGAVLLVVTDVVPYDWVKARLDALAFDGSVRFLSPEYYVAVGGRVRILGGLLLAVGAVLLATSARIGRALIHLPDLTRGNVRELRRVWDDVRGDRVQVWALGLILLVALGIRMAFWNQAARYDESYSFIRFVLKPWFVIVSDYSLPNNHVLHSLLAKTTTGVFGVELWALRLPALVAGALIVPAGYVAGVLIYGRRAGLLAAALLASSSSLVEYSTNARGYSMVCLAFVLLLVIAALASVRGNWVLWTAFVLVAVAGFVAVPVMLYPFGIVVAWVFLGCFPRGAPIDWQLLRSLVVACVAVVVGTALAYSPILVAGTGLVPSDGHVESGLKVFEPRRWEHLIGDAPDALGAVWTNWNLSIPLPVVALLVAGLVASLVLHRRITKHPPLLVAAVSWCVLVFCVHRVIPHPRVMQVVMPFYALAAAGGLAGIWERVRPSERTPVAFGALAAALAAGLAFNLHRTNSPAIDRIPTQCVRQVYGLIKDDLRAGRRVFAPGAPSYPLIYYTLRDGIGSNHVIAPRRDHLWPGAAKSDELLVLLYERPDRRDVRDLNLAFNMTFYKAPDVWDVEQAREVGRFDQALLFEVPKKR